VAVDIDATARSAAEAGRAALNGQRGPTYDALVYAGALVLYHLGRAPSIRAGTDKVRSVLDSAAAARRLR
jgi:anthranilate phosphoribosyltransferase